MTGYYIVLVGWPLLLIVYPLWMCAAELGRCRKHLRAVHILAVQLELSQTLDRNADQQHKYDVLLNADQNHYYDVLFAKYVPGDEESVKMNRQLWAVFVFVGAWMLFAWLG